MLLLLLLLLLLQLLVSRQTAKLDRLSLIFDFYSSKEVLKNGSPFSQGNYGPKTKKNKTKNLTENIKTNQIKLKTNLKLQDSMTSI